MPRIKVKNKRTNCFWQDCCADHRGVVVWVNCIKFKPSEEAVRIAKLETAKSKKGRLYGR